MLKLIIIFIKSLAVIQLLIESKAKDLMQQNRPNDNQILI